MAKSKAVAKQTKTKVASKAKVVKKTIAKKNVKKAVAKKPAVKKNTNTLTTVGVSKKTGFVAPLIPRFSGVKTFFRRPHIHYDTPQYKNAPKKFDVAIVGVPFDIGVSFRTGQREGPAAVRNISHLCQYNYHPE